MPRSQNTIGLQVKEAPRATETDTGDARRPLRRLGWEVSENGITKVESQIRCVTGKGTSHLGGGTQGEASGYLPGQDSSVLN